MLWRDAKHSSTEAAGIVERNDVLIRILPGQAVNQVDLSADGECAAGRCFLDMLGVFAEFETNLRRERQLEGIAKAKAAGVYKGRKPTIDPRSQS